MVLRSVRVATLTPLLISFGRPIRGAAATPCQAARFLCGALIFVMLSGAAHANESICQFPAAGSKDPATLTITSRDGLTQSYDLVSGFSPNQIIIDHPDPQTLSCPYPFASIAPTFIHFILGTTIYDGWLCIEPRDSVCNAGKIDCNGGDFFGFDILADSNIAHCGGNAACKNKCDTFCQNEGRKKYGSHCALPQHKCECKCIDRKAGFATAPGISQCHFGAHITIETDPGCYGDSVNPNVLVDFGSHCIPMTTSLTSAVIKHADFSQAQIGPIEDMGTPISCDQISSHKFASDTGMVLVGQVPLIFDAAVPDSVLSLHLPCVEATVHKPTNTPRPTATPTRTPG